MNGNLPADGLSAAETPQGERLKETIRGYMSVEENIMLAGVLRSALDRIEDLEADLAAEKNRSTKRRIGI